MGLERTAVSGLGQRDILHTGCKHRTSSSRRFKTAMGAAARQVTGEELEVEMTEWELPMILDVFATWCGPCVMLKPEIEKVRQAVYTRQDGLCCCTTLQTELILFALVVHVQKVLFKRCGAFQMPCMYIWHGHGSPCVRSKFFRQSCCCVPRGRFGNTKCLQG